MIYSYKIFNLDKIAVNRDKLFELKDYDGYTPELLYERLQNACKIFNSKNKLNHKVKIRKTIKGILIIKTFKMENKEKEFFETLLEKINQLAHNERKFPANHEYTSKGKLVFSKSYSSDPQNIDDKGMWTFGISYMNGGYTKDTLISVNSDSTDGLKDGRVYGKLTEELLFGLMYRLGSLKHDIPLIQDLIISGENWKESIIKQKEAGRLITPYSEFGE